MSLIPRAEELSEFPSVEHVSGERFWTTDITDERPVFYAKEGYASEKVIPATTFSAMFKRAVELKGDLPALKVEDFDFDAPDLPSKSEPIDKWTTWTWNQYYTDAKGVAKALLNPEISFGRFDGVNLLGFNSPHWLIMYTGTMLAGGVPSGIYGTDRGEQIRFKADYSNARVLAIDGQHSFEKIKDIVPKLDYVKLIVSWGKLITDSKSLQNAKNDNVRIVGWDEFIRMGDFAGSDDILHSTMDAQKPTQCCHMVFTSGTTGQPKGVMLSNDAVCWVATTVAKSSSHVDPNTAPQQLRVLSYLPLSHLAGQMADIFVPIATTAFTKDYIIVSFARPSDLKAGTISERMKAVKPTVFVGVPRVWEKMAEKLQSVFSQTTGTKGRLLRWALSQGEAYALSLNSSPDTVLSKLPSAPIMYRIADSLVLRKIRAEMGLDEVKSCQCGSAAVRMETLKFLGSLGLTINEGYGMTEVSAVTTWATNESHLWGSIGAVLPGVEAKIATSENGTWVDVKPARNLFRPSEAEQGEICSRSRGIMMGYLANPRLGEEHVKTMEDKTREVIDDMGFMHSGDKGAMSRGGFFAITGRFKELIIGSGGENVAPVPIEDHVKKICPIISNIVMLGDRRKFNIALVTLHLQGATGEYPGNSKLQLDAFKYINSESKTIEDAINDSIIIDEIANKIKDTNNNGDIVVSNAAKIQKFTILPRDLSIITNEFTSTLKLKRGFIPSRFEELIDIVYASKDTYVPFPQHLFNKYYTTK